MNLEQISQAVIGANQPFPTPFGMKPMVYADYTASGRSLSFIEDTILHKVMPTYANTHTEFSFSGSQTGRYREQARSIIHKAVNGCESDKVIFCGTGATSAINKLVSILGIRLPEELADKYKFDQLIPQSERPVVFVGPYEHHSNELPWRESIATVVTIPEDSDGNIDLKLLELSLQKYNDRPLKIGSFSAASNVTGIRSDVTQISRLLKQYQALSCWDYAAAAPYIKIDMNGEVPIDAVFFSPHKYVGGPGTPGVLVIKQEIMNNKVPAIVGGGTVSYVTPYDHKYIDDKVIREEGGTPGIVEAIRAGLVVKLQQDVGIDVIQEREEALIQQVLTRLAKIDNIKVLGNTSVPRLSIFSLRFMHNGRDLHHGFITSLFNDVFGIQVRGGCSCAGPYGHHLLNINLEQSRELEAIVSDGYGLFKPGWVRLNFNYFISQDELDYLLTAIELIAKYGYRLLPYYQANTATGNWRFQGQKRQYDDSLEEITFNGDKEGVIAVHQPDYMELLSAAEQILSADYSEKETYNLKFPTEIEPMRWFTLSEDIMTPS